MKDFAEALTAAAAAEGGVAAPGLYDDLHAAFRRARIDAESRLGTADALQWEEWLYGLQLTREPAGVRETVLVPELEIFGRPPYPPPVADFPAPADAYFTARRAESRHASVRARISEFLWHRNANVQDARAAASAYLDAVQGILESEGGAVEAHALFVRGAALASTLKHEVPRLKDALRAFVTAAIYEGGGRPLTNAIRACEALLRNETALADELLHDTVDAADRFAGEGAARRFLEREMLENAAELARVAGKHERMVELRRRIPASLEAEAKERASEGGIVEMAMLQPALRLYTDLGVSDAVERVKAKLHHATQRSTEQMQEHSFTFEIPREKIRAQLDGILQRTLPRDRTAHLQVLATSDTLWPSWETVQERTAAFKAEFPMQFLVHRTHIGPDDRPLPEPEDPEEAELFHQISRYTEELQLTLMLYEVYLGELRGRDLWSEDLIMDALAAGALFDDRMLAAVRPGVHAFENGRYWEAVHVLVPCIERAIRQLAIHAGLNVYSYRPKTGEIHWSSLTNMLDRTEIFEALGLIRKDFGLLLRYVLTDSRSLNLRDDLAHGITPPETVDEHRALLPLLILLHLSAFRMAAEPHEASDSENGMQ